MDLSKLEALKLPSKEIEVGIAGDTQKVIVSALDDESSLRITSIMADEKLSEAEKQVSIRRLVLSKCILPALTDAEIDLLMGKAAAEVNLLYITASILTKEFAEARQKTREEAKKKSPTTEAMTTAV